MIIPESFMLYGQVINVKPVTDLIFSRGSYGQANYSNNQIYIQPSSDAVPVPKTVVEESFIHEMTHHIIRQLPEKYQHLNDDEDFIEGFAQLLHQALTTQEGDINNERPAKSHLQTGSSKAK